MRHSDTAPGGVAAGHLTSLLTLLLVVTGGTGLIYQVVLGRYFALYLGSSGSAHAVTLAAFLGGLSAGALFVERLGRLGRVRRPFLAYAVMEAAIGVWMLLFPTASELVFGAAATLGTGLDPTSLASLAVKLSAAALLVLPLSALLGGTLPVLAIGITETEGPRAVQIVSRLYAVNAAGAALGAWSAGFLLIEAFGLELPLIAAALFNLLVGAAVWYAVRGRGPLSPPAPPAPEPGSTGGLSLPLAVVAAALTGAVSLLYEVVWTRLSGLVLGASVYAFSMMLVVVIAGIAIGSGIATRIIARGAGARTVFVVSQLLAAAAAGWLVTRLDALPAGAFILRSWVAPRPDAYELWVGLGGGYVMLHFLPCAVALGAAFPALLAAAHHSGVDPGRATGWILGANTLGNLVGAIGGSFVLMPTLGIEWVLAGGAVVSLGVAALTAGRVPRRIGLTAAGAAVVVGFLTVGWPQMDLLYRGLFRVHHATDEPASEQLAARSFGPMVFRQDGTDASVSVSRAGDIIAFRTNGKPDGSVGPRGAGDQTSQLMLGHVGFIHHPGAENVFVIGFGTGQTAAAAVSHPGTRVTVVELNEGVMEAAPFFASYNGDVLGNPRLTTMVTDAREAWSAAPVGAYQMYISQPSNPWIIGVGDLFTREHFGRVKAKLAPDGVAVQWFQAYELGDALFRDVLCTFQSVFPAVWVYRLGIGDFAFVGLPEDRPVALPSVAQWLAEPEVQALLPKNEAFPDTLDEVALMNLADAGVVEGFCDGFDDHLTDLFPRLEYVAPRFVFAPNRARLAVSMLDARLRPPFQTLAHRHFDPPLSEERRSALHTFLTRPMVDFETPLVLAVTPPEAYPAGLRALLRGAPPPDAPPEVARPFCARLHAMTPWLGTQHATVLGPAVPALEPWIPRCFPPQEAVLP